METTWGQYILLFTEIVFHQMHSSFSGAQTCRQKLSCRACIPFLPDFPRRFSLDYWNTWRFPATLALDWTVRRIPLVLLDSTIHVIVFYLWKEDANILISQRTGACVGFCVCAEGSVCVRVRKYEYIYACVCVHAYLMSLNKGICIWTYTNLFS